ncbi:MAG: DNA-3-methyladenine glycosylase I [Bacilli bacterium]|nr:DNA-3-methyladenine glycosylase I [Bacilli bacterium]
MKRCKWCNTKNKLYIDYHDKQWGKQNFNEQNLFEMFILEMFQAGLSWECILNKKKAFEKAYDNFNINKIIKYDNNKINELLNNKDIIRNRLKITASIKNAIIFKQIQNEYGTFHAYLKKFTKDKIYYEINQTKSPLSDTISKDLKRKGMSFVGSITIYSYLQAIGVIYSHDKDCFMYKNK